MSHSVHTHSHTPALSFFLALLITQASQHTLHFKATTKIIINFLLPKPLQKVTKVLKNDIKLMNCTIHFCLAILLNNYSYSLYILYNIIYCISSSQHTLLSITGQQVISQPLYSLYPKDVAARMTQRSCRC